MPRQKHRYSRSFGRAQLGARARSTLLFPAMLLFPAIVCVAALAATVSFAADGSADGQDPHWVPDQQTHCYVFYTDRRAVDAAAWSGACPDRVATGAGTAIFSEQGRFVESWSGSFEKGAARDSVRVNWADGSHFEGSASAGRLSGQGVLTTAQGDRYEGRWTNGELNGPGKAMWADGRQYTGVWKRTLPNGHGILTRKDGNKVEGEFIDGGLSATAQANAAQVANSATSPPSMKAGATAAAPTAKTSLAMSPGLNAGVSEAAETPASWLDSLAGRGLVAVDGSTIVLSASEDGLTREIHSAGGLPQKTIFSFLNAKQGTVADASATEKVLGVFRIADKTMAVDYADGRSETLAANSGGGLFMVATSSSGGASCVAWYPDGHEFSAADRQFALAAYASRLGISMPTQYASANAGCGRAETRAADLQNAPSSPKPDSADPHASVHSARTKHSAGGKTALQDVTDSTAPILVRTSQVHLIDPVSTGDAAVQQSAPTGAGAAARCLSVEANGAEWGFRNRCGFAVQFAYCIANGRDRPDSCDGGAVTGGVIPNGFDTLFAEKNSNEADHDFRWIACSGRAGEVVPRLVRADPPAGRCMRPQAS